MTRCTRLVIFSAFLCGLAAQVWSQHSVPLRYDRSNEIQVQGVIEDAHLDESPGCLNGCLAMVTARGSLNVNLGPAARNLSFIPGQTITIIGSKISVGGHELLLARTIDVGGTRLTVRDANGLPQTGRSGARTFRPH